MLHHNLPALHLNQAFLTKNRLHLNNLNNNHNNNSNKEQPAKQKVEKKAKKKPTPPPSPPTPHEGSYTETFESNSKTGTASHVSSIRDEVKKQTEEGQCSVFFFF